MFTSVKNLISTCFMIEVVFCDLFSDSLVGGRLLEVIGDVVGHGAVARLFIARSPLPVQQSVACVAATRQFVRLKIIFFRKIQNLMI